MSSITPDAAFRLGLLLTAGGMRCRRLVARADGEGPLHDRLLRNGAPAVLVETAARARSDLVLEVLERVDAAGWRWLAPGDATYPELLRQHSDPPLGLFVRRKIPGGEMVAVVGSRRATSYGQKVARLLGQELGSAGVPVLSGMARGVDAEAHRGAITAGGPTVAVWGTGPDRIYPPDHGHLAESIAACGAIVTEYPPGTPPRRHHFTERNRIIAGMATAVVVVEAAVKSGALVTARLALDENREVLAVPGSIFSDVSTGPNALIRMGARPLLTLRDVFESLSSQPESLPGAAHG